MCQLNGTNFHFCLYGNNWMHPDVLLSSRKVRNSLSSRSRGSIYLSLFFTFLRTSHSAITWATEWGNYSDDKVRIVSSKQNEVDGFQPSYELSSTDRCWAEVDREGIPDDQWRGNRVGRVGSCPPNCDIEWASNVFCPPNSLSNSWMNEWMMFLLTCDKKTN